MSSFSQFNATMTSQDISIMRESKEAVKAYGTKRQSNRSKNKYVYEDPVKGKYLIDSVEGITLGYSKKGYLQFQLVMRTCEGLDEQTEAYVKRWKGKNPPRILWNFVLSFDGKTLDYNRIGIVDRTLQRLLPLCEYDLSFETVNGDMDRYQKLIRWVSKDVQSKPYYYIIDYDPNEPSFQHIKIREVQEAIVVDTNPDINDFQGTK